jgi:hypothetical protein
MELHLVVMNWSRGMVGRYLCFDLLSILNFTKLSVYEIFLYIGQMTVNFPTSTNQKIFRILRIIQIESSHKF